MPSISDFVSAAGEALATAQSGLVDEAVEAKMAVAEARLDLKVAVDASADELSVQTVSLADIATGSVEAAALSTIRLDFVAVGVDPEPVVPAKTPGAVIKEVSAREDLAVLERIFDGLTYRAEFVASQQKWLVVASSGGTVVRETLVPDSR